MNDLYNYWLWFHLRDVDASKLFSLLNTALESKTLILVWLFYFLNFCVCIFILFLIYKSYENKLSL